MHPQLAGVLAEQHHDELTRQAGRRRAAALARGAATRRGIANVRLPHYRVHWSRTTQSPVGAAGRPERSWVIVISASRGL